MPRNTTASKIVLFCSYNISDVFVPLIITNFRLYLIELWWSFFQIFANGDVVNAQTWEVLNLKNSIELPYALRSLTTGRHEVRCLASWTLLPVSHKESAFVLTPVVRICRVRALRERKYQLPSYCHYIDVRNVIVVVAQGPKLVP